MIDTNTERLRDALSALRRIERRLVSSRNDDGLIIGATIEQVASDSDDEVARDGLRALDAFVQRFEQYLENITTRTFPATITVTDAGHRAIGLTDILNRLERYGWIDDGSVWPTRRELRNRLIHEYPFDRGEQAKDSLAAIEVAKAAIVEMATFRVRSADVSVLRCAYDGQ